ncbi:hypothetical protein [Beijerinckia indica]|uniref:Uncharacterized protein n=1 Tax=Beijerinckia indica subsp. indica (strain ATCC 9039 / DSM 1715 / NCIMB 8712) TaxID=395963 RepID=B2IFA6_BEII9|nr:hypothetical protein [Beijerinckia indica]ACB95671.1 hypothetical protein Bind_2049 [Beijerinckia indica subsp. indica ATCC 9039]
MSEQKSVQEIIIPDYVARHATSYQIDEFRKFFNRIDLRGKRVLEIGCDYNLVTARLFAANGADYVATTISQIVFPMSLCRKTLSFLQGMLGTSDLTKSVLILSTAWPF